MSKRTRNPAWVPSKPTKLSTAPNRLIDDEFYLMKISGKLNSDVIPMESINPKKSWIDDLFNPKEVRNKTIDQERSKRIAKKIESDNLLRYMGGKGQSRGAVDRVNQMLEAREAEEKKQKIAKLAKLFEVPKAKKKRKTKQVVFEEAPESDYTGISKILEIDTTGFAPVDMQEDDKPGNAKKKSGRDTDPPKLTKGAIRNAMNRKGAPLAPTELAYKQIAADRAAREKMMEDFASDEEDEIEVIPYVFTSFEEKQRLQAEKTVHDVEAQILKARRGSIRALREVHWTRRYWLGMARAINLKMRRKKGTYSWFTEDPAQVIPQLFFGSQEASQDADSLLSNGITHVVNITMSAEFHHPGRFIYLRLRVDDNEFMSEEDGMNFLHDAAELLGRLERKGACVLVHCHSGISRAPTAIIAHLIVNKRVNLKDAIDLCTSIRPEVDINRGFKYFLALLEFRERGFTSVHYDRRFRSGKYNAFLEQNHPNERSSMGAMETYYSFWWGREYLKIHE